VTLDQRWFTGLGYQKCQHAIECFAQFGRDRDVSLLDDVIALTASADSDAVSPSGLSASHFLRGEAYRVRYDENGSLDDLTWALRAMRQATEEDPEQDRGYRLRILADTLLLVVEQLEPGESLAAVHLNLAEKWLREALPLLGPAAAPMCQGSLGLALLQRFRHFGSAEDWNAAVDHLREACGAANSEADRAASWGNLGKAYAFRYNAEPRADCAALTVEAYDTAARISPPDDPNYGVHQRHQAMIRQTFGLQT
jgi:hypothetical protein